MLESAEPQQETESDDDAQPECDVVEILHRALREGDPDVFIAWMHSLAPGDIARGMAELSSEEKTHLLQILGPAEAADLIDDLPDEQSADILEEIPVPQAAAIIEEMDSDDRADVLGEMEEDDAAAILDALSPLEAREARELLSYPPYTAGGVMIKEYVAYPMGTSVGEVLEDLRSNRESYHSYDVRYFYVIDKRGVLHGVLRLRDLVLSSPKVPIEDVMIPNPRVAKVNEDIGTLQYTFETNHYSALPVVDANGCILGVVLEKEILEAARKRANRTLLKLAGIFGGEELRSMPAVSRAGRRLTWLYLIMGLSMISVFSISMFESTLERMISLTVFMPIVSNMVGCAGNQAVALSLRELTLGVVKPWDLFYVLVKEMKVGILNGCALGLALGVIGYFWKGTPMLGGIVGAGLAGLTILSVVIGGVLPLLLKRLRIDPAIASGPILTTLMDTLGFFLLLAMTALALRWTDAASNG